MQETPPNQLTKRNWAVMFALALTGQIAWAVENSWFNTFVFDTITPDPRPIAWMVAASAVTATLTTLIMGTLSDRTRTRWENVDHIFCSGISCGGFRRSCSRRWRILKSPCWL